MKSALPFLGVPAPLLQRLVSQATQDAPCQDEASLQAAVLDLWRKASHREHRYAALDLLQRPAHRKLISLATLPVVEELLHTGPWWDFNDEISGHVLPVLLQRHPAQMKARLRQWACSDDLWQRRAAMLTQRSLKVGFDAVLLYDCILPSLQGSLAGEFFIRKGMGWALRERSYSAPEEVQAFCAEYAAQLSPLTVREALKAIRRRQLKAG
jgi:3-methyladenine DNA glycosylase AlkD